jgi:hypothetical protein
VSDPLDPDSDLEAAERELGAHLASERQVPASEFRGGLRRHLAARDRGVGPRPEHLRRTVALFLAAGGALLAVGLLLATTVSGVAPARRGHARVQNRRPTLPPGFPTGLPAALAVGFTDDFSFELTSPAVESAWLSRARSLGSSYVRLTAYWSDIAPVSLPRAFNGANPGDRGYNWRQLDQAVREARAHGQTIVLMALRAPRWAEPPTVPPGVGAGTWLPNAGDFGAFGRALAERYSGRFPDPLRPGQMLPWVQYFQAWNEPNLPDYLLPQWEQVNGAWEPASPGIYRGLLNAFYAGVKAVQPESVVLSAGTAPYGDPPATEDGRMQPVTFLKALFCLTPRLGPAPCPDFPHLDALDHHPYSIAPTIPAPVSGDVSVPDLGKISAIIGAARRYGHVVPDAPKPLWVTEIDWASTGVDTPGLQAEYLAAGLYELWRQGVSHVLWYGLNDQPLEQSSFITAGLYLGDGAPKPAAAEYRFPFAAVPVKDHLTALWGKAPALGTVSVQERIGSGWKPIVTLRTTSGGIFYAARPVPRGTVLRAMVGGEVSPSYRTS